MNKSIFITFRDNIKAIFIYEKTVTVIRNGCEEDIQCQNIMQGDLVKASRDCDVPCDIVLLKSSDSEGKCFITTANLDGETNLKTLFIPRGLPDIPIGELKVERVSLPVSKHVLVIFISLK